MASAVKEKVVAGEKVAQEVGKPKISAKDLGMEDIQFSKPSAAQRQRFPNVLANVRLNLVLKSVDNVPGKDGVMVPVTTKIGLRGLKVVKPVDGTSKLFIASPSIGNGQGRPFYLVDRLGPVREACLIALYNRQAAEWAKQPELPSIDELPLELPDLPAATVEQSVDPNDFVIE